MTLLGSSSGRNAGDAALMSGIMDSCDEACGKKIVYEIPTINPSFVRKTYQNKVKPISMMPWDLSIKMLGLPTYRSVTRTNLSVIFDAILFDRALYNPLFNFLSTLHYLLPKAKKAGAKLAFFDVGIGPIDTRRGSEMLLELSETMDFITVRDEDSYNILKDIGVKNPRMLLAADAALLVKASDEARIDQIIEKLNFSGEKEILAVNINAYLNTWARPKRPTIAREHFLNCYAEAIKRIHSETGCSVLLVSTQHHDHEITEALLKKISAVVKKCGHLSNREYNHFEIKGVLNRSSLLFAMRLHSMILASSGYTPIIGLAYQPKIHHYFSTLGLNGFDTGFDNFGADMLYQQLKHGWENRAEIRSRLEERIPALRERAKNAARLVAALNQGKELDSFILSMQERNEEDSPGARAENNA